jgi:hypothetical protein
MLAGKTASSNAMVQYAPNLLVFEYSNKNAHKISATPLNKTNVYGYGSKGGIIFK